jgi:hypothetical protein
MFWFDEILKEEEWSLSAKLFSGLVFNPFSIVNNIDNSLFVWFWKRITGENKLSSQIWRARPEYIGKFGRNDWRLHIENWEIAIECKFGDGIDIKKDCLQYLKALGGEKRCVVVIASVSEFSELTRCCTIFNEITDDLKHKIKEGEVVLVAWHEILEAAMERLPPEKNQILRAWANKVKRNSLLLMPEKRLSGKQTESLIIEGKSADIPITHRTDARGDRKPTSTLEKVCNKRDAPDWVRACIEEVYQMCVNSKFVFEVKKSWINVRVKQTSRSLTLFPYCNGLALLISHPDDIKRFPAYSHLDKLGLQDIVPINENWFPRARTIGIVLKNCINEDKKIFADSVKQIAISLMKSK